MDDDQSGIGRAGHIPKPKAQSPKPCSAPGLWALGFGPYLSGSTRFRKGQLSVLPRDRPAPIWGWAAAGSTVVVSFGGQEKTTRTGNDGRWIVRLDPMSASTASRTMTITVTGPDPDPKPVTFKVEDVVVGDVWLCSGQSNMEFALKDARDGATDGGSGCVPRAMAIAVEMTRQAMTPATIRCSR